MKNKIKNILSGWKWAALVITIFCSLAGYSQEKMSGNPVLKGWYADPDAAIFNNEYWIVPTTSVDCREQVYFDAFSSPDLVTWTKHSRVVDSSIVKWAKTCYWAPGIATKNGKYYIFFSAKGPTVAGHGIGVCVADKPSGPYRDLLGKPLLDETKAADRDARGRYSGAQPIDQFIFKDSDGVYYMLYGGEGKCNMVKLNEDFTGFVPHADGSTFKEITPHKDYVEGSVMFKRNGKYYFMWSEGLWFASNYRVAYGIADTPYGPFERKGTILIEDQNIAAGPGHHSIFQLPGSNEMYMVYHRKPIGDKDGNHRYTCVDKMEFDKEGNIKPIKMTFEGVEKRTISGKKSSK